MLQPQTDETDHLRHFIIGASNLPAREPISSTHSALVNSPVRSYHLVAACFYTLALDTHRCGVRATCGAVNHLQQFKLQQGHCFLVVSSE